MRAQLCPTLIVWRPVQLRQQLDRSMSLGEAAAPASQDAGRAGSPAGQDSGAPATAGKKRSSLEVVGQPVESSTGKPSCQAQDGQDMQVSCSVVFLPLQLVKVPCPLRKCML